MTEFRALMAQMAAELDHNRRCLLDDATLTHPLADRSRYLLAEPADGPAAPPAEGEVAELVKYLRGVRSLHCQRAAELLERPAAPVPVPVSERLPGPEDCTAQGWCWVFYRGFAALTLEPPLGQDGKHTGYTHWLPAHALPLPAPQGGETQP